MTARKFVTLLIATLKGGTRKSTTAMMLAFAYAARGFEVLVVDADAGTQGVTDWASKVYAADNELPFHVVQWAPHLGILVPFIKEAVRRTGATIVIVDVGGEHPEVLKQAAILADLAVSPIGAEQAELGRISATATVLEQTPMRVLLTRVPAVGLGKAAAARESLAAAGYTVLKTETPQNLALYSDVWGSVPTELGAYEQLADELNLGKAA